MTRRLPSLKKKILADRETRAAYDAMADEFGLARELIAARARGPHSAQLAQPRDHAAGHQAARRLIPSGHTSDSHSHSRTEPAPAAPSSSSVRSPRGTRGSPRSPSA